jgi:hypothetical protein
VRPALESLSPTFISQVLDGRNLDAMRASEKLGDLIAEAMGPPSAAGRGAANRGPTQ